MSDIEEVFESYPKSKYLWETTDGYLFIDEKSAKLHAASLKDSKIVKHKKEDVKCYQE